MMAVESLFLTSSSLFILLLPLLLFQTSLARPYNCTPSACGIFPNISSPLRLIGHPKQCGYVELACENNVTSLYLNSHKFYVKEINYTYDATMRVVDASVHNDICSFPTSSAIYYDYRFYYEYYWPINFISCPHPLKNSSGFTETTPCQTPTSRFTYIKVGRMKPSEVPETCRVDVVTMTSWRGFNDLKNALLGEEITSYRWSEFNDFKNTSLEEINSALLYGFQLYIEFSFERTKWEKFEGYFQQRVQQPLLILLPFAVVFGAAISPVMAIIGFIVVLVFILSSFSRHFQIKILWGGTFDPLYVYAGDGTLVPRRPGAAQLGPSSTS